MKRIFSVIFILILFLVVNPASLAEDTAVAQTASDDLVLRAQIRLSDLGYLSTPPSGFFDDRSRQALAAYRAHSGLDAQSAVPDSLFLPSAVSVPYAPVQSVPSVSGITGAAESWENVQPLLIPGNTYTVAVCNSGITFQLIYDGGTGHAEMHPALDWDAATMLGLFEGGNSLAKLPVVISVNHAFLAASLQMDLPIAGQEQAHGCRLFFTGSTAGIGNMEDAEHNAMVRIAAGETIG